jgi:hypothetical protein
MRRAIRMLATLETGARMDGMGVKLNFNNFRAQLAPRVSIEELRLILEDERTGRYGRTVSLRIGY